MSELFHTSNKTMGGRLTAAHLVYWHASMEIVSFLLWTMMHLTLLWLLI